jgi:hypothetical protein
VRRRGGDRHVRAGLSNDHVRHGLRDPRHGHQRWRAAAKGAITVSMRAVSASIVAC